MAIGEYVDLDLYGRGFDGIYGYGAEQENKRQALMAFKAIQRFKKKVKPGEYIDLDLYGRGDPRIFGPGANIQTQKEAWKHLEEAQRRKQGRHRNANVVVFPPGLKAITKKANALMRCVSAVQTRDAAKKELAALVEGKQVQEEKVAHNDELIPDVNGKGIAEILPGDREPDSVDANQIKEINGNIVGGATPTEKDETVEVFPNNEAHSPVDKNYKVGEVVAGVPDRIDDEPPSQQESCGQSENVDNKPKRVRSKLPNEEVRPHVEKGHVARVVKSLSSFDRSESQTNVSEKKEQLTKQSHLAEYSSLPFPGTSSPEVSESESSEADKSGSASQESATEQVLEKSEVEAVSITNEEGTPGGVLVDSDEEFQLSFSAPPNAIAIVNANNDHDSTSSEEGLLARNEFQEPIVLNEAGRSSVGGSKIAGLFRSGDTDSESEYESTNDLQAPRDPSERLANLSTEDGQNNLENDAQVREISIEDHKVMEEAPQEDADPAPARDSNSQHDMGPRDASIIQVVETPAVRSEEDFVNGDLLNEFYETPDRKVEMRSASINITETGEGATQEGETVNEQAIDTTSSSSSGTDSSTAVDYEESFGNDGSGDMEAVSDSDRSAEAASSSAVITSSEEAEDSDEIEIEEVEEVEEEEHEAVEREESLVEGVVHVVDSSDAEDTYRDGDEGRAQEEGQKNTFWQRLSLFGVLTTSCWIMF